LDNKTIIRDESLKSLIKMGALGFYPLFDGTWINEVLKFTNLNLSKIEKQKAKRILLRLEKHKSLDRKKTILLSLGKEERDLFIKAFLKMVEGEILDQRPEIQ
jgi:hypothetical protein